MQANAELLAGVARVDALEAKLAERDAKMRAITAQLAVDEPAAIEAQLVWAGHAVVLCQLGNVITS